MLLEPYIEIVKIVLGVLGIFGALFIIYGAIIAIYQILEREARIRRCSYNVIRRDFTTRILIGLEFFVAADIIRTILDPTLEELVTLGSIVAIRTVVSYFLEKEAEEI
jgi:uncharacterized membrane protein